MKRLLLFTVLLACVVSGQSLANPITRQKALENAQAFLRSKGKAAAAPSVRKVPSKAAVQSDNQPYYLFNVGNNQGFVVAAGDDNVPAILGYSDKGTILPDSLPSNMKEWLKGYQEQIEYIQKHNIAASDILTASHPAISSLLTTTWDQDEPYNNSCPDFFTGDRCVTGCVATAMAQVMYYHRNSSVTKVMKRIEGYTCRHKWISGSDTLRVNVNAVAAGSTIDWSNMLNSYSGSETSTQKKAVADLMFYCGASVGMDYADQWNGGSGASSSYVPNALKTYFGYSDNTKLVNRSSYSATSWDNLIYSELSNKRPVFYSGRNSEGGHAFVCDGYDGNGYYHINWGWGGYCDSFFLLDNLLPEDQGIGGSNGGFNQEQAAIIGAEPIGNNNPDTPDDPVDPDEPDDPITNGVVLNSTNFPDATFRAYISELTGVAENGTISEENLLAVKTIDVGYKKIATIKGVEHFAALETLICSNNFLASLDVEKNTILTLLWCDGNQLTNLNISKNIGLTSLRCQSNQLTSLDVTNNISLYWLDCSDNKLTSLDVSKNTTLEELRCVNNKLTILDVSKNTALTDLGCQSNQLTALDVSMNIALTSLYCAGNQLTSLDVSKNTALTGLSCFGNQLISLDVSKNTALAALYCYDNQLTSLNVSQNLALRRLYCYGNQLSSLDVTKNAAIEELYCYNNQLTRFNVSKNTVLKSLRCNKNMLTSLDVSMNTALKYLHCSDNQLTSLYLKNNTKLSSFDLSDQATTLAATIDQSGKYQIDVPTGFIISKVSEFKVNDVTVTPTMSNGKLTFASSSKPTEVTYKYDTENSVAGMMDVTINVNAPDVPAISGVVLNSTNFPDATFRAYISELTGVEENGTISEDKLLAVKTIDVNTKSIKSLKGVEFFTALTRLSCIDNQLTSLDVSKNTALTSLGCSTNKLTSIDVSKNTALTNLSCYYNQLTSLDVSKNTALTLLYCFGNQLTSLDVSKNIALTDLWCHGNQLTNLDVSKNTALTYLSCNSNQLTSLDVTKNCALTILYCYRNQLTSLDLTKNTAMEVLDCSFNQLTSLDVSKNTALEELFCNSNKLTNLDLSKCSQLVSSECNISAQSLSLSASSNGNRFSINVGTAVNGSKISDFKVDGVAVTPSVQNGVLSFSSSAKPQVITYMYDTDNSVAGKMDVTINLEITDAPVLDGRANLCVSDFSVHQGEGERMSINMVNEDEIIMAEFYMQLPEGLHIATDADGYYDATLGDRADRTHTLEVGLGSNGLYHFLAYSTKNKPFTGNEGELLSMNISCDENVEAGIYQGTLRNILMSNSDKQAIEQNDISFNIEVTDYLLGDVNYDRRINGMDIVEMVTLIMENQFDRAGDLYPADKPDGVINGMDLVQEVELVMSQTLQNSVPAKVKGRIERVAVKSERSGVKSLGIESDRQFILAQLTVELSDGMTLSNITSDRRHEVACRQTGSNKYVVVCYSNRNESFEANGQALQFHCVGDGDIKVSDVLLIDADKQECLGTEVQSDEATGISTIDDGQMAIDNADVYDLQGRKIESSKVKGQGTKLQKGVYIINKQKVTIK